MCSPKRAAAISNKQDGQRDGRQGEGSRRGCEARPTVAAAALWRNSRRRWRAAQRRGVMSLRRAASMGARATQAGRRRDPPPAMALSFKRNGKERPNAGF